MLDLFLSKGKRFESVGVLDVGIHIKPTSQGVPLCNRSWHLPSTHRSWPSSRLLHYKNVCSNFVHFQNAAFGLFEKIRIYSPAHPSLGGLAAGIANGVSGNGKLVRSSRVVASSQCSRLILPYHPCFSELSVMCSQFEARFVALNIAFVKPVPVFSLGGRSIASRMQRDCRTKLRAHYRYAGPGR